MSLLPSNSTKLERDLEDVISTVSTLPVPIPELFQADNCPAELLPWLAWAFSADGWLSEWPENVKRGLIRDAVQIHEKAGTPWAVKHVLKLLGFPNAKIQEGLHRGNYDGTYTYADFIVHGDPNHWAYYNIILDAPINNKLAVFLRQLLGKITPARSHLRKLSFTEVANIHDHSITYDGNFNHGAIA